MGIPGANVAVESTGKQTHLPLQRSGSRRTKGPSIEHWERMNHPPGGGPRTSSWRGRKEGTEMRAAGRDHIKKGKVHISGAAAQRSSAGEGEMEQLEMR